MSERGYADMIRVLGALPGTIEQVTAKVGGPTEETVVRWLRAAVRLRIVHVASIERTGRWLYSRTFAMGPGAASSSWARKTRVPPGILWATLASILRALAEGPVTVLELCERTAVDRRQLHDLLALLRAANLARIASYEPASTNWAPEWEAGSAPNAPWPKRQPRSVVNARAWAKRRDKLAHLQLIAATAGQGCGTMVAAKVAGATMDERRAA